MDNTVTPDVIEAMKTLLKSPSEYGLKMRPFQEYFKESHHFNPQHVLAEEMIEKINKNIPKIVIYLLFEEFFGSAYSIGASAGYYMEFVND